MTRLELVRNLHAVIHRRCMPPSHALALILMGGTQRGLTRHAFMRDSGLSETATRRVLEHLVRENLASRHTDPPTPPSNIPPYIYRLTAAGESLTKELLNTSA